jgi:hypothetical protein
MGPPAPMPPRLDNTPGVGRILPCAMPAPLRDRAAEEPAAALEAVTTCLRRIELWAHALVLAEHCGAADEAPEAAEGLSRATADLVAALRALTPRGRAPRPRLLPRAGR